MARSALYPASVQPGKPRLDPPPPGWFTVTLRELMDVVERPAELLDDQVYQLVTARRSRGGIVARDRLTGREILTKSQFFIKEGDFLISNRQIVHGGCGLVPSNLDGAIVSNEYTVLRATSRLLPEFLQYLSHSIYLQQTFFQASVGVDVEKMVFDSDQWLSYRVNLPPLPEQRKIIEILDSVENVIRVTQEIIEQATKVKDSTLAALFMGRKGHAEYKSVGDWRIGRLPTDIIPRTWRIAKLADVSRLESGHTPSRKVAEYWDGDIPWLSLHDTKSLSERVIFETEQKTTALGIENSSARILPAGTVAFSRTASVGHCVIMGREMATSQDFANYICGDEINNRFLMHLLRFMAPVWAKLSSGSTHQTVYMPVFEQLQIALPPMEEQLKIAEVADAFFDFIEAQERQVKRLSAMKSALIPELLTGRKRVNTDLPIAAE